MILSLIWLRMGLQNDPYLDSNLFQHTWGLFHLLYQHKTLTFTLPEVFKNDLFFQYRIAVAQGCCLVHRISNWNAGVVHVNVESLTVSFTRQLGSPLSVPSAQIWKDTQGENLLRFFFVFPTVFFLEQAVNLKFLFWIIIHLYITFPLEVTSHLH